MKLVWKVGRLWPWLAARPREALLAGVALGFTLLHLTLMGFGYALEYDEALYLSQTNPSAPDAGWSQHRAWGAPILAAPVALLDAPVPAIRLYLIVLSSVGLYLAYRAWLAVDGGLVAPIAAALFGGSYAAVYNGGQVMPNYYAALGGIAATAYFLRCGDPAGGRRATAALAVSVAFTALVRPTDSLWLVAPLAVGWLALRRWRRPAVAAGLAGGLFAGWAPWIIEAFLRFGGPIERLRAANDAVGGGLHLDLTTVKLYVRMLDAGRMGCISGGGTPCEMTGPVGPGVIAWLLVGAALIAFGVIRSPGGDRLTAIVPIAVAASLAFSYLFLLRYGYLRFLLPAGGLAAVAVARGLVALAATRGPAPAARHRRPVIRRLGIAAAAALLLAHVVTQAATLHRVAPGFAASRASYAALIHGLQHTGIRTPCLLVGHSATTVAYPLSCGSERGGAGYLAREPVSSAEARAGGRLVAVISREDPPADSYLRRWRLVLVPVPHRLPWRVYLPPDRVG
jgi:hypothetical protein